MEIRQATILPDKGYTLLAVRSGACQCLPRHITILDITVAEIVVLIALIFVLAS
ncbi:uncharacterized protein ASPGLDRAFT_1056809 [Aspergillus glaucus CBS 516.65]|uniref:Uncharacterized protein n=1 Tax=Aspergillus glaucus CBS 516.65 TaxID=1160497 RepID=A0A1L9V5X2_ASPGL|nr:hypothetical protein ASPGLDRAFT_1056809 [Aspergillus glaucus CBS 516.65]OJJ79325.1 hypothetical protein ASPGLDRAFT_1056809 [Aspergillus glaucus CBS 516.65]